MKFSRIFFSALTGLLTSLILALTFFHYSTFTSLIDRLFLVLVPALAFGILYHQTFPAISAWARSVRDRISILEYLISFLITLNLIYGAIGFLQPILRTPFGMFLFVIIALTIGTTLGYFLVQRAAQSFRTGFLSKPLNLLLALSLPIFWIALIVKAAQHPSMFTIEYILVPQSWMPLFLLTALASAFLALFLIPNTSSLLHPSSFILHHLPGLYASTFFFLIELIIARSLNHPALEKNTVLFEADAGPWMTILASPESAPINRAVHPLSLILIRPLVRLVSGFMGEHYAIGGMIVVSLVAAACVFMTWLFVKRATNSSTYAFIFSIFLGSTATHLLFGSLAENYIFGAAALIFFFLLIQSNETRFSVLVPAGLFLFGITITNIAQGVIALFFSKFNFKRLLQYSAIVIASGILLTLLTNVIYPKAITFFFVPNDIAFEFNFVKSSSAGVLSDPIRLSDPQSIVRKLNVVGRSIFLYGPVGPRVIEATSDKPPFPTIDLKTFDVRSGRLASYRGLSNVPLALWLMFLVGAFVLFAKNFRTSKHGSLMLSLLGALGFNLLLHLFYGTELFLYTPYWVYSLALFVALAYSEFSERQWLQWIVTPVVLILMMNNFSFIFSIFHALAPFYTAVP
ncbi:MAG TPA: hypothetical protein PKL78_04045 [Anaerolineales bacterium]|nr:hypothetical protein [Anaerolineales bacterium]